MRVTDMSPEAKEKRRVSFRKWYLANIDKRCQWYADNLERSMWNHAKTRARKRNMKFNITREDIVIPEKCPVLGVFIGPGDAAPSLDRINSKRGYVKGNIQVISKLANRVKNNASLDQLILIGKWAAKTRRIQNASRRS